MFTHDLAEWLQDTIHIHIAIWRQVSCEISSSLNHTNFILENVDLEPIRLLNNQAYLTYDGTRIKWAQDFSSLQNFVKNVAGLSGEWESPGGRAKRFNDSNLDFVMTWYPGKLNSLIFHGKEGESFKKFLVRILQTNSANQTDDNNQNTP